MFSNWKRKGKTKKESEGTQGKSHEPPEDFEYSMQVFKQGNKLVPSTPITHLTLHHPLSVAESLTSSLPKTKSPSQTPDPPRLERLPTPPPSHSARRKDKETETFPSKPKTPLELHTLKEALPTEPSSLPFPLLPSAGHKSSEGFELDADWELIEDTDVPEYHNPAPKGKQKKVKPQKRKASKLKKSDEEIFHTFFKVPEPDNPLYDRYLLIIEKEHQQVRKDSDAVKAKIGMVYDPFWVMNRLISTAEESFLHKIELSRHRGMPDSTEVLFDNARNMLKRELTSLKEKNLGEAHAEASIHLAYRSITKKEKLRQSVSDFSSEDVYDFLYLFNPSLLDDRFLISHGPGLFSSTPRFELHRLNRDLIPKLINEGRQIYRKFKERNPEVNVDNLHQDDILTMARDLRPIGEELFGDSLDIYSYRGFMMWAIGSFEEIVI
ncbi:hypothetical protein FUAX_18880 [Fulvitalea axinellae]|uniref:Uncharacterized protein n=1 Tax=Fulvitalea axinellae TaxID=1182444 RepID=A0AAU9CBA8_9BACT|nr:hypothetical protein FUAX_18880 [Fulvitalea axinellae]